MLLTLFRGCKVVSNVNKSVDTKAEVYILVQIVLELHSVSLKL